MEEEKKKNWFIRNIPNMITTIRYIAAVVLIFLPFPSLAFYLVYGICGLSDAIDGFVAKKFHLESKFGTIYDSVGDLLFYTVMGIKIFPTLLRLFIPLYWVFIIVPTVLHIIAYIICAIKFHKFASLHTYANKALGLIVFFFPFALINEVYLAYTIYICFGSAIALYSGVEEILIHLIAKEYNTDNKMIFFVKRNERKSDQ